MEQETDLLSRFEWPVAVGGYRWVDTNWGPAITMRPDQPGPPRRYLPFSKENSGLFVRFAQLLPTKESVLSFVSEYGMLGPPVTRFDPGLDQCPEPEELFSPIVERRGFLFGKDGRITDEPSEPSPAVDYLGLWPPGFEKMLGVPPVDLVRIQCWSEQIRRMSQVWEIVCQMEAAGPRTMSNLDLVCQWVNEGLSHSIAPRLTRSLGKNDLKLKNAPRSLIGTLWMQFALSLSGDRAIKECPVCKRLIVIAKDEYVGARADATFCGSTCRSQDYRDRKKLARQLKKNGWRIPRIARQVRSDPQTVRGWLTAKK